MFGLSTARLAIAGIMVLTILGLGLTTKTLYDRNMAQRFQLAQKDAELEAAATRAAIAARLNAVVVAKLQTEMASAVQRADRFSTIRSQIHAAANSSVCAASPPMRALLAGLRKDDPAVRRGAFTTDPAGAAKMRTGPGAPVGGNAVGR